MSAPNSQIQWYLAREGKQFGPLTETELSKFIELGHLLPTDLVWREGFAEWRPAPSVFPPKPAAPPSPPRPPAAAPQRQPMAQQQPAAAQAATTQRAATPQAQKPQAKQQPQRPQAGANVATQAARPARPGDARGQPRLDAGSAAAPVRPRPGEGPAGREYPPAEDFDDDSDFQPGGQVLRRAVKVLILLGVIGGAGYFAYPYRAQILSMVSGGGPAVKEAVLVADRRTLDVPPFRGLQGSPDVLDNTLQQTALWRVLKREFPEWYTARIQQVSELSAQNKAQGEIAQQIAQALVLLRRQQLNNALSASVPRLKLVASTFFENLVQLRKTSDVACFEFIARGEASPLVITMLQGSPQVPNLQAQMTAVYEAIADGRKTPRAYPQPRKEDYEKLALDLTKERGWTQADLQLFTDERALAQAPPAKICQLVHDWFAAQLDIKDLDMQVRLLVDSLKPVVAG